MAIQFTVIKGVSNNRKPIGISEKNDKVTTFKND